MLETIRPKNERLRKHVAQACSAPQALPEPDVAPFRNTDSVNAALIAQQLHRHSINHTTITEARAVWRRRVCETVAIRSRLTSAKFAVVPARE